MDLTANTLTELRYVVDVAGTRHVGRAAARGPGAARAVVAERDGARA